MRKLAVFGVLAACQGAEPKPEPQTPPSQPTVVTPPHMTLGAEQELRSPYRNPALTFKVSGTRFDASYQTHHVSVTKGSISVTPQRELGEQNTSFRFETADVFRGALKLDQYLGTQAARNELHVDRGTLVEEIENREEGVEQRWHFDAAPSGQGDLVFRIDVAGHDPERVTTTKSGLHFFAAAGLGVRYSNARWIDSAGVAYDLPSEWVNNQVTIRVPEQLIASSKFPATLDPTIEAEEGVDDAVFGNSGANAGSPYLATRGDGFLAVWSDNRLSNKADIFAARITAGGVNLDSQGLVVNTAAETQTTPVATRVGSDWVVIWKTVQDIAGAKVTDDGTVTQLGTVVATAANEQLPAIASNNTNAVAAWQSGTGVAASVYNGSFGAPFSIAATGSEPAVGASPAGYIVSWHDDTSLKAQLLDSAGAPVGAAIDVATAGNQVSIAYDDTNGNYILAFVRGSDMFAMRVSTTGTLLDTMPVPVSTAAGAQAEPSISCDSASCYIIYSDTRDFGTNGFDLYGQRVDLLTLAPIGAETQIQSIPRYQLGPSLARASGGWIGVWDDQRTGGPSLVMGSRFGADGSVTDPTGFVVNVSLNSQIDAFTAAAPNATQLVLWSDSRVVGNDIMGVRYASVGGARLDNPARTISGAANDQATPTAAWDGTQFVSVWSDARGANRDIYTSTVNADGTLGSAGGTAVTTAAGDQFVPDIASNGAGTSLVVWMDRRNGDFDIFGAIINGTTVTTTDIAISVQAVSDQNSPAVTWDATSGNFIVVWSDQRGGDADIFGTRVSPTGTVLDAAGVEISGSQNAQVQPDIAVSGGVIVAVWDDRASDPTGDILGARLSTAGNALTVLEGTIPISYVPAGRQNAPTIVAMPNSTFLTAWTDHRDALANGSDIYGVELDNLGHPRDVTGFAIAANAGDQGSPAFQNDPNDNSRVALVYQYFRSDLRSVRVFRRLITGDAPAPGAPNGTVCVNDAQCGSGFCVDSRCCNSACGGSFNHSDCQTCSMVYGGTVDGMCTPIVIESICRNFATFECDLREYCDGVNPTCPADEGRNAGQACTTPGGAAGTCPADAPPGPHVCQ